MHQLLCLRSCYWSVRATEVRITPISPVDFINNSTHIQQMCYVNKVAGFLLDLAVNSVI